MKKRALILFLLISILAINLFYFASAQIPAIDEKAAQLKEVQQQLSEEQTRNQYLQNKVTEYMSSSPVGKVFLSIHEALKTLNPIFKFLIGIEYSFSSLFLLTLLTWIVIMVYIHRSLFVFDIWLMEHPQYSNSLKLIITLVGGIILSSIGITPGIALLLSTPYYLFLTLVLVIVALFIQRIVYNFYPIDTPLRQTIVMLFSGAIGFIAMFLFSVIPGLQTLIEWMATLPSWMNKLIVIVLFVFLIYYSMAYSKMLKVYFKDRMKKKQLEVMSKKIDELKAKDKEEGLSIEERKELSLGQAYIKGVGKAMMDFYGEDK